MLRSHSLALSVTARTRFHTRQIKVSMKSVEGRRRKFVSPFLDLRLCPTPIQADDIIGEIFGERQPILAFTDQDIANSAAGRAAEAGAARFPFAVEINQKYFPMVLEAGPVIPGLAGFKLRVGPPPPCGHDWVCHLIIRRVVVKNPLAGLADQNMRSPAHFN